MVGCGNARAAQNRTSDSQAVAPPRPSRRTRHRDGAMASTSPYSARLPGLTLTVLGSGTAIPSFDRFPAGYLLEGGGSTLLVDCGPGVLRRLAQAGCGIDALDGVFLTHFHPDHCADVAALLFALRNRAYRHRKPLQISGARGLHEWFAALVSAWPWLDVRHAEYPLELRELDPGDQRLGALQIGAFPVQHTAQSLAYRVQLSGAGTITLSGDADEGLGLVDAAREVELFVCDSAFPDALYEPGHLTPGRAGRIAQAAHARRLLLTHFYPACDGIDLVAQARATFQGDVSLAHDLLRLTVG